LSIIKEIAVRFRISKNHLMKVVRDLQLKSYVAPHPHIGLVTVTYLFDGELDHRDSLGTLQTIRPGAVNWMTAGRGIVHSERTPAPLRGGDSRLFGTQAWIALPSGDEETAPDFAHYAEDALPIIDGDGTRLRLIAGSLCGARAPVRTFSEMFYADARLAPAARLQLPPEHEERAVYVAGGAVDADGEQHGPGRLLVLRAGAPVALTAGERGARLLLLGGAALDGPRHVWWNFVSSSRERIEQAKADWQAGRFAPVPGERESIPLPQRKPPAVDYP
jgi:redox-sensitive bicupin YhaK (pirin superfamily)